MDNRPIGVFDSGLGGLTVVKELMKILPGENLVYFGDTARVPYGTRSNETVIRYSKQCIRFLLSQDVKMIVIACNTVSSISLDIVNKIFDIPILGVIGQCQGSSTIYKNKRVGIIGTQVLCSKAYEKALAKHDLRLAYSVLPALFLCLVEEGWSNTQIALLTAERYLDSMKGNEIDTLLLGCTHFPLLQDTIGKVMGPDVT